MDPVEYLLSLEHLGIKFGLDNIRAISAALGNPQDRYRSIIVAGTNGKGSVTAMVDAILGASGLRTARYTSPHLVRLEERFVVVGRPVATASFHDAVAVVHDAVAALRRAGGLAAEPTFFEVTTAVGFELFRRAGVDIAVLEVGMGGRFDATNIVRPMAGAITTIDFDHERYLGRTLGAIASEMAGIVKPGMTVVTGEEDAEPLEVIEAACRERGARLVRAREGVTSAIEVADGRVRLDLETPGRRYEPVTLGLRGRHQADNAIVAVRVIEALAARGVAVEEGAVERGLSAVSWRGRLDLVEAGAGRRVLFDAAHNPAGARALAAYLREVHPRGLPLVFGVMRDKDAAGMLATLLPLATQVIFTEPPTPRAAPPDALVAIARQAGREDGVEVVREPIAALERAWQHSPTAVAAGSIFLVGDLLPRVDPSVLG